MTHSESGSPAAFITGLGILSALGIGVDKVWENLSAGRSGIQHIGLLASTELPGHIAGEVKEFTPKTAKDYIRQRKSIKVMCRDIQLGVAAATLALDDAGLVEGQTIVAPERLGVDFGANLMLSPPEILSGGAVAATTPDRPFEFQMELWGEVGMRGMEPLWLLQFLPNMPACHIGIYADARGPNNSLTMADVSGNMALCEALRILTRGAADIMITGTTGTTLHAVKSMHAVMWDKMAGPVDGDPAKACRPFDLNRIGQVAAEGAGTLILEQGTHARARGAKIYGRVLGAGSACVANKNGDPDYRQAMAAAMRAALKDAGLEPKDIGHINAYGLGEPDMDVQESLAIHDVFGPLGSQVPVTAFKSYWGNPGSSSGTLETIGSLLGLLHGVVLPTLNYETPDPKCPLNVVHGAPLPVTNKKFIKISVTRMSQASVAVLEGA